MRKIENRTIIIHPGPACVSNLPFYHSPSMEHAVNTDVASEKLLIILIAPNVSEQMGGQAIKALQIWLELDKRGIRTHQITHHRAKWELDKKFSHLSVSYVPDSGLQRWMWKTRILRPVQRLMFQWQAAKIAGDLLKQHPRAVVHYTAPVSPVLPAFRIPNARVVMGPINGNIYYPPSFRHRESRSDRYRRLTHPLLQFGHRFFFRGKQTADVLLVSGGDRTYRSLQWAGCRQEQFVDSIDSGILDRLKEMPLATHTGRNLKFVHNGRLVDHKGADLVIRAVAQARNPITLEIIGRGEDKDKLKHLTAELGLEARVTFTDWIEDHSQIPKLLQQYRAFVFPSLSEANGIVVQEAMMIGLPVIALDWGGPSLLVTPECGVLVKPTNERTVIAEIAKAMDELAENGDLAQRMAVAGRQRAIDQGFLWSDLITKWIDLYRRLAGRDPSPYTPPLQTSGESRK
jgi:glycosyltransferase involved in cell wall biosynthesis